VSYDPSVSTARDKVRLLIGDTSGVVATELLTDGELDFLLAEESNNIYRAGAEAADRIAAKYARMVDTSIGDASVTASQRFDHYRQLAVDLRSKALERGTATPFVGGISRSDVEQRDQDTDAVTPFFRRTNPGDDRSFAQ
jgi:hypothetical protein